MFLLKEKRKNGINLCIAQSYRDPVTKVSKTKRIMNIGYLEELQKEYEDPIAHFQEVARQMTEEYSKESRPVPISLDPACSLEPESDLTKNFGYAALSVLYHELKLDVFFRRKQRALDTGCNLNSIVKLLVYGHILFPGSEKQIFNRKRIYFDKMDFSLEDLYRSFAYFQRCRSQLQSWIHERICENYGRDTSRMYYYVTNHYFGIDEEERLRRAEQSKELRPDPIIQMGLFIDQKGLPVSYDLFPRVKGAGGEYDAFALSPTLKKTRRSLGTDKVIILSGNGINSPESLYSVLASGNGYIVSPSIRSAKDEIKEYALRQDYFRPFGHGCKVKSRSYAREIRVKMPGGRIKSIAIREKLVVLYNEVYARWARAERENMLLQAEDLIASPGSYNKSTAYDATKYVKNVEYDKKTGEILQGSRLYLDEAELKEEEKYDGYYIFLSSELDQSPEEIIDTYNRLWEIEESFKMIDRTYDARPPFVSRTEHMHTHFLTCFVSLVLTRLLEMKIDRQYPLHQAIRSMKKCNCVPIEDNLYIQSYYDSVLKLIGSGVGIDFSKRYRALCNIKESLRPAKKE